MKVGRLVELVCIWDVEEARIAQNHTSPCTSRVLVWALYNLVKKRKKENQCAYTQQGWNSNPAQTPLLHPPHTSTYAAC